MGASCQGLEWALAAVWQLEHFVEAEPPSNFGVPGVPWQDWQYSKFFLACRPWKSWLVASSHTLPKRCGAALPWHIVLLKQPGAVPAGAGAAGWFGGFKADPGKWHWAQTTALEGSVVLCVRASESFQGFGG